MGRKKIDKFVTLVLMLYCIFKKVNKILKELSNPFFIIVNQFNNATNIPSVPTVCHCTGYQDNKKKSPCPQRAYILCWENSMDTWIQVDKYKICRKQIQSNWGILVLTDHSLLYDQ